ncbi:MAG: hypothetical protein H6977_05520 [Gammaproteobacteria bacterium]|nr:hypothetical protein [Gammaproteobacteria bacterium]
MTLPRLAACLLLACTCLDAAAFQLGQLVTQSRLGEPLVARVAIFGANAAEVADLAANVRPAIGLATDAPERRTAERIAATIAVAADGQPYVVLRTDSAVREPAVRFRLRLRSARDTVISHYALALVPAAYDRPTRGLRRAPTPTFEFSGAEYGPVTPGQTLWRIVRELGFAPATTEAVMQAIVDRNPQAFVGGVADRLRVGAMLSVPDGAAATAEVATAATAPRAASSATPVATPPAVAAPAPESIVPPVSPVSDAAAPAVDDGGTGDAAIAARLAELSRKFAGIRARYAAQQAVAAPTAVNGTGEQPAMGTTNETAGPTAPVATPSVAAPRTATEPRSAAPIVVAPAGGPITADSSALPLDSRIVLGVGALISLLALIGGTSYALRRRRLHHAHGATVAAERELVAEIARKTEKRLQLEGEVAEWLGRKKKPASTAPEHALDEIDNRIAHGQYADAERMLREVIGATPTNFRAKLRLAEICYLNERTDEFVELASELQRLHRADIGDDGWQRVVRMGRVLAPERPPFSGPVALEREA